LEFPTGYVFLSRRVFGSTLSAPSKANPKMIDERVRMARGQIASAALASFSQSSGLILRVAVMDRFVMDAIVASVAKKNAVDRMELYRQEYGERYALRLAAFLTPAGDC
jgi:hypothetical protein